VFVRQAIARKLEPVADVAVEPDEDVHDHDHDSSVVDDHDEEAEEA
jgi:hypothetical protein